MAQNKVVVQEVPGNKIHITELNRTVNITDESIKVISVAAQGPPGSLPSLTFGKLWVGGTSNSAVESRVLHLDEVNNRLGINTVTPDQDLHIEGNIKITGALYDSNDEPGNNAQVLSSTGTSLDWINISEISGVGGSGTENYLAKWDDAAGLTDSIVYSTLTDVGIGTADPQALLDVERNSGVIFKVSTGAANSSIFIHSEAPNELRSDGSLILHSDRANAHSNSSIQFKVDNSPKMIITSLGKVGIGTSAPDELFTVDGIIKTNHSLKTRYGVTLDDSNYSDLAFVNKTNNTGYIRFLTYDSSGDQQERLRIANNGNVGIGTTSPGHRLDVGGNIRINSLIYNSASDDTNFGFSGTNDITFKTDAVAHRLYINGSGNIGIGTSSPLNGFSGSPAVTLNGTGQLMDYSGALAFNINSGPAIGFIVADTSSLILQSSTSKNVVFKTNGGTEAARFDSSGKLGIGTTSPGQKLHVDGNIRVGDSSDVIYTNNLYGLSIADLTISTNGNTILTQSGNVGIKESSPSATLHVGGTFKASLTNASSSNIVYFNNDTNELSYSAVVNPTLQSVTDTGNSTTNNITALSFTVDGSSNYDMTLRSEDNTGVVIESIRDLFINTTQSTYFNTDTDGGSAAERTWIFGGGRSYATGGRTYFKIGNLNGYPFLSLNNNDNNEKVRFDSNGNSYINGGNVGIGTTSPGAKLDIQSDSNPTLKIVDTTNSVTTKLFSNNFDTYLQSSTRIILRAGTDIAITSTGGVGVGVTNPPDTNRFQIRGIGTGSTTTALFVENSDQSALFLVNDEGNVGIGTTTPSAKLHVSGDIKATLANTATTSVVYYDSSTGLLTYGDAPSSEVPTLQSVTDEGSTTTNSIEITTAQVLDVGEVGIGLKVNADQTGTLGTGGATKYGIVIESSQNFNKNLGTRAVGLYIPAYDGTVYAGDFSAHFEGKLLLGGDDSIYTAKVYGILNLLGALSTDNLNDNTIFINGVGIANQANYLAGITTGSNTANLSSAIHFVSGGFTRQSHIVFKSSRDGSLAERMRITDEGKVGIGITAPSETLDVAGNIKISEGSQLKSVATQNDANNTEREQSLEFFLPYRSDGTTVAENKSGLKLGGIKFFEPRTENVSVMHVHGGLNFVSSSVSGGSGIRLSFGDQDDTYPANSITTTWNRFGNTTDRQADVYGYFGVSFTSTQASGYFKFSNSTGELFRIASNGNVGIGTTSPTAKLEVDGSKTIPIEGYNEPAYISINPTIIDDNSNNNSKQQFLRIAPDYTFNYSSSDSTGAQKAAISITPNYKGVADYTNDANGIFALYSKPSFDSNIRGVRHYGIYLDSPTYNNVGTTRSYYPIYVAEGTSYFGGDLDFSSRTVPTQTSSISSPDGNKITLESSYWISAIAGNAINLKTPSLYITGSTTEANGFVFKKTTTAVANNTTFHIGQDFSSSIGISGRAKSATQFFINRTIDASTGNLIDFQEFGSSRFLIDSEGKVGIGTTSPDTNLHLASSTTTGPTLRLSTEDSNTGRDSINGTIEFESRDGTNPGVHSKIFGIQDLNTNGALAFAAGQAGTLNQILTVHKNRVLIGSDPNAESFTFNPYSTNHGTAAKLIVQQDTNSIVGINIISEDNSATTTGIGFNPDGSRDPMSLIAVENAGLRGEGHMHFVVKTGDETYDPATLDDSKMVIKNSGNIGIGTTTPDASAILDLDSTTQGVLFPRMTGDQRIAISSPATGLIVYQTDADEGLYIYKSTGWIQII